MTTKLILVEGLPGSGKSTTAQLVMDCVKELGREGRLFMEGDVLHPADYEGTACLTEAQYEQLRSLCTGEEADLVRRHATIHDGDFFLPYRQMEEQLGVRLSALAAEFIHKHDVYELPFTKNEHVIAAKWRRFVEEAADSQTIYVFECCFIQNPVTVGMIKYDAPSNDVIAYVQQLDRIIAPLDPLLLYVKQPDLAHSFRKAVEERPTDWRDGFIDYYTKQGYGAAHDYHGLDGTIEVLKARAQLEEEMLGQLGVTIVIIDNSTFDRELHKERIARIVADYLAD
ncbi:hypothetical protein FHS18_002230 [Paenibacillus phyllosphaerae]|uniref:Thymidylate kinase n=1 Tax=Paenibacillus phyllosphaerae TaxID=274593 RepID=A0A7W5AWL8_9BACL|nr:hypothetical protein [Paenibacillus phyllosphaerae]MBB3110163.1 hypothetical protein [Paenibacillus phyllosphaerae]